MSESSITNSYSTGLGNLAKIGDMPVVVESNIPHPPEGLDPYGQQKWYEIATLLKRRGTWSTDWVNALYTLCSNLQMLEDVELGIRQAQQAGMFNMLVSSGAKYGLKVNPILDHRIKLIAMLQTQMAHFGLTPISAKACFLPDESTNHKDESTIDSRPRVLSFDDAA